MGLVEHVNDNPLMTRGFTTKQSAAVEEKDMSTPTPADAVDQLIEAIIKGDLDSAVAAYEPGASLVVQPGKVVTGAAALREAISGFVALKPTMTTEAHQLIQSGDIAQYISRWSLKGRDPNGHEIQMNGISSDILRRQADGRWLIALDNPWGVALLDKPK
jgi:ketosteroid isomerase-like protein